MSDSAFRYRWFAAGDVNAFFALASDNLALLAGMTSILVGVFHMPVDVVVGRMVPGTAIGVVCGDLIYSWLAFRLARKDQRQDVCAMPFGIDTPSMFALTLGVVGPAFLATHDAMAAWRTGCAVLVLMGIAKIVAAFFGEGLRRILPPAALIASISAIALVLIMFFPFTKIFAEPIGGLVALGVVLVTLVGHVKLPAAIPAVLLAVLAGLGAILIAGFFGYHVPPRDLGSASLGLFIPWPSLDSFGELHAALRALPIALPIALVTVVGGIDNTESARLAGDHYSTRSILLTEGIATLLAALCGGVVQNTPYVGHPAYKKMGARAGYTLATSVFIGLGAVSGVIGYLMGALPESLLVPILVYVGLEMAAQANLVTDRRLLPALPLAVVPVMAYLINVETGGLLGEAQIDVAHLSSQLQGTLLVLQMLGNGFVMTSMLWVALMVWIIEKQLWRGALLCAVAALLTSIGLIHSPYPDGHLLWPVDGLPFASAALVAGYAGLAFICAMFAPP